MPIFDFNCKSCGKTVMDRFFHTISASDQIQRCRCGSRMEKLPPLISFNSFKPFYTHNLIPDGSGVYVRDRAQLRELMRRHGVRQADESLPKISRFDKIPSGPRPRPKLQRGTEVGVVTAAEAAKWQDFARRTEFGQRASR